MFRHQTAQGCDTYVSKAHSSLMILAFGSESLVAHHLFPNAYHLHESYMILPDTISQDLNAFIFFTDTIDEQFYFHLNIVKEKLRGTNLPIVVISKSLDKENTESILKNGADDCFREIQDLDHFFFFFFSLKQLKRELESCDESNEDGFKPISPSKRLFDILFASVVLLILSPLMILIALLIRMESKGPIFYISKRAGSKYQVFDFLKFRTMFPDADKKLEEYKHLNQYAKEENDIFVKIKNDPRITFIGGFLRKTSLDELPQLINVLKGDMSIVGNRPLPLYEAKFLTKDEYATRFMAPAGITGLWQVTKRGKDDMSNEERISLDIKYAIKNSFLGDLSLLSKTIPAMIQKEKV